MQRGVDTPTRQLLGAWPGAVEVVLQYPVPPSGNEVVPCLRDKPLFRIHGDLLLAPRLAPADWGLRTLLPAAECLRGAFAPLPGTSPHGGLRSDPGLAIFSETFKLPSKHSNILENMRMSQDNLNVSLKFRKGSILLKELHLESRFLSGLKKNSLIDITF